MRCTEDQTCVAFVYDEVENKCYLLNSTYSGKSALEVGFTLFFNAAGLGGGLDTKLIPWRGFTTGLWQQPVFFAGQWFYQRHARIDAKITRTGRFAFLRRKAIFHFAEQRDNLYACIESCERETTCKAANFDYATK